MTILALTGLQKEAKIIAGQGVVAVSGGGTLQDAALCIWLLNNANGDLSGVISIGIAGALSPHLRVGDVIIADQIVAGGECWRCHEGWRVRLNACLPHAHQGTIVGSDTILKDAKSKAALFNATGALAVDMESRVAAKFAASRNLPFAGLRVISDDATHVLPPAALVAMKPDGGIALGRVIASLLRRPQQVPALIRTARTSNKAFAELLRCLDLCGVGIAGADL